METFFFSIGKFTHTPRGFEIEPATMPSTLSYWGVGEVPFETELIGKNRTIYLVTIFMSQANGILKMEGVR